jgi:hypothetical protein
MNQYNYLFSFTRKWFKKSFYLHMFLALQHVLSSRKYVVSSDDSMFYFLYLDVYFIFFDLTVQIKKIEHGIANICTQETEIRKWA